ncbi:MAG: radical SAM protein [Pseudomonadota bacterium]
MGCSVTQQAAFGFTAADVATAVHRGRLLSMEIEFSLRCSFQCPYCYVPPEESFERELTPEEIRDTITQAKELGARKIIVLGGEPSIYPHLEEMIGFIRGLDLEVEMFTNGTGVTAAVARMLKTHGVRVVLKMNSFDEALQDRLAGKKGAYRIIHEALAHLQAAGYPAADAFLAVSTVICRQNIHELPDLWQWLRDRGIVPYVEIITPQANAIENTWLDVPPPETHQLFKTLAEIDRTKYGRDWDPQPPLVGNKCLRHQFSCLVNAHGEVMPCVGVTLSMGNIRQKPLKTILAESAVLKDLKNYRHTIKGPCRDCEKAESCYGCRGAAFQLTGDPLASDPLCWKNYQG